MDQDRFSARRAQMIKAGLWKDRILLDYFDTLVATKPQAPAIVAHDVTTSKQTRLTYAELADRVGVTLANLSILKTGKARAIRFSTLDALCRELKCQPGDILIHEPGPPDEPLGDEDTLSG